MKKSVDMPSTHLGYVGNEFDYLVSFCTAILSISMHRGYYNTCNKFDLALIRCIV